MVGVSSQPELPSIPLTEMSPLLSELSKGYIPINTKTECLWSMDMVRPPHYLYNNRTTKRQLVTEKGGEEGVLFVVEYKILHDVYINIGIFSRS